jgi:PKD repeat protein
MKSIKNILSIALVLLVFAGCEKDTFNDLSFVETASAPANLNPFFNITQDNTGLVTITPNGEGATAYDIYYGHGPATAVRVVPGASITHVYPEGVYNVRSVAYGISGKISESTKQLTVSFRAPENVQVTATIDAGNKFKVNVSATAQYETLFKVKFGDGGATEVPVSLLEGETISHIYAAPGTYTVTVTALSGGVATTTVTKSVVIEDPVTLPINLQSSTLNYASFIGNFDGGALTVASNPAVGGINTSTKVLKMVKNGGQPWGGSTMALSGPIDFSAGKIFRMKVWSPRVGATVLLKVEGGGLNYEKTVATTVANEWEDLVFDYTNIPAGNYSTLVFIFDNGTMGDGSSNFTFYMDDIRLQSQIGQTLPINFQSTLTNYFLDSFGGAAASVENNPDASGINTSTKVGKFIKGNECWSGTSLPLEYPIFNFTQKVVKMKVWSPAVGKTVKFKFDYGLGDGSGIEVDAVTTVANAWEELTFDFTSQNPTNPLKVAAVFFDFNCGGGHVPGSIYYFDDITLN